MRFRFTLRRLLFGVGIVAVACACWPIIRQAAVSHQLQTVGTIIQLDDDTEPWFDRPPKGFADHIDADITEVVWDSTLQNGNTTLIDDESFSKICTFPKVWNITLDDCAVTDQSIGSINQLPFLSVLRFRNSQIGDEGVRKIATKGTIENLILANSSVTDDSAAEFKKLPKLYYLDLSGTMLTDKSVPELAMNDRLTFLNIRGTSVTTEGLADLQAALPNCKIVR